MKKKLRKKNFHFVGKDSDLRRINELDGTTELSYEKKFELACQLSLFEYQLRNNTTDVPRLLRTTACIRKA
jgi:hypothetical protein